MPYCDTSRPLGNGLASVTWSSYATLAATYFAALVGNDCKNVVYDGLKISDTPFAMVASHTPCTVQNSLFIGESGNLGEPNEVRLRNGTKVMWHRYLQTIN